MKKQLGNTLNQHVKQHRPKPVFMDLKPYPNADCPNCGDRGFLVAFFADYTNSCATNEQPHPGKEQCQTWIENEDGSGAWWLGKHRTYPCPVCRTQILAHDGGNGRMRR